MNILCIMRSLGRDDLSKLHAASAWWAKKGHPAPLFFTLSELHHSADIFAIELLDIKAAHRILHGEDVIASLHVPMDLHRLHVERELRNNTLRLRQHYLMHPADSRKTLELMTSSISTFAALFRHALIALGEDPPPTKRATIDRLGSVLGLIPLPFTPIFEIREGPSVNVMWMSKQHSTHTWTGSPRSRKRLTAGWQLHRQMNSKRQLLGPDILTDLNA